VTTPTFLPLLTKDRTETDFPDKKPTYTRAEALSEAERCLYCADAPCIKACPTEIDIPTFIKKIATDNVRGSAKTIFEQNLLGYSCARVCPVEVLCVGACVYNGWHRDPIQIGRLQRYATETATADPGPGRPASAPLYVPAPASGKKVALIGAGPASLACAGYLAILGHKAVIFEKRPLPGGLNTTGIAPYKLHAEGALHEIEFVQSFGVEIKTGITVGSEAGPRGASAGQISGKQLLAEYDAVYIGVGLGADSKLGLPGEDGPNVFGATAWIEEMKLARRGTGDLPGVAARLGRVLVIGGGNTAIDVARECALLGATDVTMVYRRGVDAMSGYHHEMEGARKEGVKLVTNALPVAFVRDASGKLTALRVARAENGAAIRAVDQTATEYDIPCDHVAVAIGQARIKNVIDELPGVALDANGNIAADPKNGQTGNPKVFSGGDCINGGKEVVNAVADGRNTARYLDSLWKPRPASGSPGSKKN
jgi:dihydropyrimidine dehydrogenase (NAD+) subunit PreT